MRAWKCIVVSTQGPYGRVLVLLENPEALLHFSPLCVFKCVLKLPARCMVVLMGGCYMLRHPEACRGFFTDGCDNPLHSREPHRANDFRGCANDFTKYQNMSQRICQDCQTRGQIILLCYFGGLITFFYQLPVRFLIRKSEPTPTTKTIFGVSSVSTKNGSYQTGHL